MENFVGKGGRVKALAFNRLELAAMALAVDGALASGVSQLADCFPSNEDLRVLKRLSYRFWTALGVRDVQSSGS